MHVENKSDKRELPPGSAVYVGNGLSNHSVSIREVTYNEANLKEKNIPTDRLDEIVSVDGHIQWFNIDGLHNVELIKKVGEHLGLHVLTVEDILNTFQRPKVEIHDNYIFATLKLISFNEKERTFVKEQISIILQEDFIFTFQELPQDAFSGVMKRLQQSKGFIRKKQNDYLFYSLIDSIIDEHFHVIEKLDIELESIEEKMETGQSIVSDVQWLKKEMLYIRRSTAPVYDMIKTLLRQDASLIQEKTYIYLRDTQDHCIQIQESVELTRDILSGLIEMQLSIDSNKMNEVMKYLTIFASIFIPLTFVTGIYGMNFEFMPELKWKYGYYYLLGLLSFITLILYFFFKRKKWL